MGELPGDILLRLGPSPQDMAKSGASRVVRGNGLVAKIGRVDRIAREAFLFGEAAALLPLNVPELLDAGPGWILMKDAGSEGPPPGDVTPLVLLAPMHELFEGAPGIEHERFRDLLGGERERLLAPARESANAAALPEGLMSMLTDPSPLTTILSAESRTLVHGEAWPGNVVARTPGDFMWLDWEEAGGGPAAFDLAVWLYGSSRIPGSTAPEGDLGAYLAARTTPVEPRTFKRAVDAAAVLRFLLLDLGDLPSADPAARERVLERFNELALPLLASGRSSG